MFAPDVNPIPNILTSLRLVCGLLMFGFMACTIGGVPLFTGDIILMRILAFIAFIIAAITDFLDGYLARVLKAESEWGAILDPIADKILVAGTILGLVAMTPNPITLLPLGLILFREFAVSALRESAAAKGVRIKVASLSKWKTFIQMLALGMLLLDECWLAFGLDPINEPAFAFVAYIMVWIASALTCYTGLKYFMESRDTIWKHDRETHPRL